MNTQTDINLKAIAEAESAPVQRLYCACCGAATRGRQWHNRDIGYGLCDACIPQCVVAPVEFGQLDNISNPDIEVKGSSERASYGIRGVHWDLRFRVCHGDGSWLHDLGDGIFRMNKDAAWFLSYAEVYRFDYDDAVYSPYVVSVAEIIARENRIQESVSRAASHASNNIEDSLDLGPDDRESDYYNHAHHTVMGALFARPTSDEDFGNRGMSLPAEEEA